MDYIKKKIFRLGGTELTSTYLDKKDENFNLDFYLKKEKLILPSDYIFFSRTYGFNQFNRDVVFKSIEKLPITDETNLCPIDFIYGWGDGINSLQETRISMLDQIDEKYFVFAEGAAGDQICYNTEDSKIYYFYHEAHEGNGIFLVAHSFSDFIKSLQINIDNEAAEDLEEEWFSDDF